MVAKLTRTDLELGSRLRVVIARLARRTRQVSDHALTVSQLSALAALDKCGPLSPRALADQERVQPPSMTRILAVLEERDLAERAPHPTDGRQVLVTVTAEGVRLLKEDRRRRTAWIAQRLAELTPDERAVLHAATPILERLLEE